MSTTAIPVSLTADVAAAQAPALKGLRLYEATAALNQVREWLVESEGEWTPEIEALMDLAEGDFAAKAERTALFIRELATDAETILSVAGPLEREAKRAKARANAKQRAVDSLKSYLVRQLEAAGKTKVEGLFAIVRLQNNPKAAVTGAGALTQDTLEQLHDAGSPFARYVPPTVGRFEVDADAIAAAWKADNAITLPEGVTVTQPQHLRID
ncbi:MAG: hypothetical protein JWL95_2819 [Gemmatimonadetes bacterium]|nr:hypothetical protein [Gemmatimonadota bacterium]